MAEQNDVRLIATRHFERIGENGSRSFDFEGVMSNASEIQIQKFHHAPPIRFLSARRKRRARTFRITPPAQFVRSLPSPPWFVLTSLMYSSQLEEDAFLKVSRLLERLQVSKLC
jgi:hypothetical protein